MRELIPALASEMFGYTTPRPVPSVDELAFQVELFETAGQTDGEPKAFCLSALRERVRSAKEWMRFQPDEFTSAEWLPSFRTTLRLNVAARRESVAQLVA